MSINLIGVSASGGIPLFCRQKSSISSEGIPFVKMASLNSVNLFSRLNDANLRSTLTADSSIHWKIYRGSIVLILVTTVDQATSFRDINSSTMDRLLDFIFDTIILTCGLSKLIETNTESLKSSLRSSFPAIDYILDQLYSGHSVQLCLQKFEFILTESWATSFMEPLVDTAARLASSQYCCLIARRRIVSATKHWWTKIAPTRDALLIINLVNSFNLNDSSGSSREATIYLPENCPNNPVRLVAFMVAPKMIIVFLCGESPSTQQLKESIIGPLRESRKDQEIFKKIVTEKRIPLHLDENIINLVICRSDRNMFTLLGSLDSIKVRDLLKLMELSLDRQKLSHSSIINNHLDCYVKFSGYKGYACESNNFKIYILLPLEKQLNDFKRIGEKTLSLINKEKKLWP
ncbi:protein fuzzy homolog [Panonychus citri]|uniref:protein fuzzy homolog n=1 Tax=Panonychus citri TaxID=50023 RepID=UPI002307AC8C|nr:protein fuzzy homolog [Panonychus citri]